MPARYLAAFDLARVPVAHTDVLVIGTGIAGLYTALKLRGAGCITVLTKRRLEDSNTEYAQGGIAAAVGSEDSPRLHMADTFAAGAGLCDPDAVAVLVEEGPACVRELAAMGTQFDMSGADFALTREAAHGRPRILHARGDATGDEIRRALEDQVHAQGIDVREDHYVIDLLTYRGQCWGALTVSTGGALMAFLARATVLCAGGAGQLYSRSTNPEVATGDGVAMAFRAGAAIQDVEFMQFHPTALAVPGSPRFLISEAVRGEGALLYNSRGERFMPGYHSESELAPRDIVARAIVAEMRVTGEPFVLLDATGIPAVQARFPTIQAGCLQRGFDLGRDRIPVAPAAHYMMGGIRTDTWGQTALAGLYACGEVASTGIHGANRLASNSLLEGLVFGRRIATRLRAVLPDLPELPGALFSLCWQPGAATPGSGDQGAVPWDEVQNLMWEHVGILRAEQGLRQALGRLEDVERHLPPLAPGDYDAVVPALQLRNLVILATLVTRAALLRTESRGGHFRTDYPDRDDTRWQRRIVHEFGGAFALESIAGAPHTVTARARPLAAAGGSTAEGAART